jgi:hypothetical protein
VLGHIGWCGPAARRNVMIDRSTLLQLRRVDAEMMLGCGDSWGAPLIDMPQLDRSLTAHQNVMKSRPVMQQSHKLRLSCVSSIHLWIEADLVEIPKY